MKLYNSAINLAGSIYSSGKTFIQGTKNRISVTFENFPFINKIFSCFNFLKCKEIKKEKIIVIKSDTKSHNRDNSDNSNLKEVTPFKLDLRDFIKITEVELPTEGEKVKPSSSQTDGGE